MESRSIDATTSSPSGPPVVGKYAESPGLVGNIVEKGFSAVKPQTNVYPPRPTILPFPVVRHRSFGTVMSVCVPLSGQTDQEDENRERAAAEIHPEASLARPVHRKQKKGLDFSRWKEFVRNYSVDSCGEKKKRSSTSMKPDECSGDGSLIITDREELMSESSRQKNGSLETSEDADMTTSSSEVTNDISMSEDSNTPNQAEPNQLDPLHSEKKTEHFIKSLYKFDECPTICPPCESDIDAQNNALLENMSPDEIANARSEIISKMNPLAIEMLKKRGRDKVQNFGRPKLSLRHPGASMQDSSQWQENQESQFPSRFLSVEAGPGISAVELKNKLDDSSPHQAHEPDMSSSQQSHEPDKSTWNTWTDRVESIRELRFSFDGCVVQLDHMQESISGNQIQNVVERDLLRTEGDPARIGYTIKEAVALIRSTIPGQRVLALQLLSCVLIKAICCLQGRNLGCKAQIGEFYVEHVDWQAVWAFTLGPEPKLVLSLRLALDDHNISVVLACVEVIQLILCCSDNYAFLSSLMRLATYSKGMYTAPVFRSRPEFKHGFLRGGYWKYSAKTSSINPHIEGSVVGEGSTIQDDTIVAEQDVAAGLVRMLVLPRMQYLLAMHPVHALEERILSILGGVAQHSPSCADAIMSCPGLIDTVNKCFLIKDTCGINPFMIKAVALLKVLAQSDRKKCEYFVHQGIFQDAMGALSRSDFLFDIWLNTDKEEYALVSALMVEQLSFWKICIRYGYCVSYFTDFFQAICLWLSPPESEKIHGTDKFLKYASVVREAYHTFAVLARRLPCPHSETQLEKNSVIVADGSGDSWSWTHALSLIDIALKWLSSKNNPYLFRIFSPDIEAGKVGDVSFGCLLSVIAAVMNMLKCMLDRLISEKLEEISLSWMPEIILRISQRMVEWGSMSSPGAGHLGVEIFLASGNSIIGILSQHRHHKNIDLALPSVCCLHGFIQLIVSLDKAIQRARSQLHLLEPGFTSSVSDKIIKDGMFLLYENELRSVLASFMTLLSLEWHDIQSVEMFGRGGPAPGVGVGWGAICGGFWSSNNLLAKMDAELIMLLLKGFPIIFEKDAFNHNEITFSLLKVNTVLCVCLLAGPSDMPILENALDFLLQPVVLKLLWWCIYNSPYFEMIKSYNWDCEEDFSVFCEVLKSHFRTRWLLRKNEASIVGGFGDGFGEASTKSNPEKWKSMMKSSLLDTIHEGVVLSEGKGSDTCNESVMVEWAYQRLPLPTYWFLSALSTIEAANASHSPSACSPEIHITYSATSLATAKAGLFFILGLEVMSTLLSLDSGCTPVLNVPLVWKIHALTMVLLVNPDVLTDEKSRDIYVNLQMLCGQYLDKSRLELCKGSVFPNFGKTHTEFLKFKTDISESYPSFTETLVEQFSAVSYGDFLYGRQVALYLNQCVDAPVRLATWSALSNFRVLELLPPIHKCIGDAQGYLSPAEENIDILEAYIKSWITGSLERAVRRESVSFTMVIHHVSSFIFQVTADDKIHLRKKLIKTLLRSCSEQQQQQQQKEMMLKLIHYEPQICLESGRFKMSVLPTHEAEKRYKILSEACDGNCQLLMQVEKLKS